MTGGNQLAVNASGSDTINSGFTEIYLNHNSRLVTFVLDKANKNWSVDGFATASDLNT